VQSGSARTGFHRSAVTEPEPKTPGVPRAAAAQRESGPAAASLPEHRLAPGQVIVYDDEHGQQRTRVLMDDVRPGRPQ